MKYIKGNAYIDLVWTSRDEDPYHQYILLGGGTGPMSVNLGVLIRTSKKSGTWAKETQKTYWPGGTVLGIKTRGRAPDIAGSLEPLDFPAMVQMPSKYEVFTGIDENLVADAPFGYVMYIGIMGIWDRIITVSFIGGEMVVQVDKDNNNPTPISYFYPSMRNKQSPFTKYVYIYTKKDLGDTPESPEDIFVHLYHVTKINAEITPPHATPLRLGQYVGIQATPSEGRTLNLFEIDGVDYLGESLIDTSVFAPMGVPIPPGFTDGMAVKWYGPVTADVYVSAIAAAITVEKEIPEDIQMTTTDCYEDAESWSLGATDLPSIITPAISESGLITFDITPDMWDSYEGGVYNLEVIFEGYSKTVARNLLLTMKPFPAFGTVWDALPKLGTTAINKIFYASDGTIYIASTTKIWKTTDLSTFTEMTLTGSLFTAFTGLAEAGEGKIVACDARRIWVKEVGSDTFTQTAMANTANYTNWARGLVASPDSMVVGINGTTSTGTQATVDFFDINSGNRLGVRGLQAAGSNGWIVEPGVITADEKYIFSAGGTNRNSITLLDSPTGTRTFLFEEAAYGSSEGIVWKDALGALYTLRKSAISTAAVRKSTDNGLTWGDEKTFTLATTALVTAVCQLKRSYAIIGNQSSIMRTTNDFDTVTTVATVNGVVKTFCRIGDNKILAGTTGTTNNLYLSEV